MPIHLKLWEPEKLTSPCESAGFENPYDTSGTFGALDSVLAGGGAMDHEPGPSDHRHASDRRDGEERKRACRNCLGQRFDPAVERGSGRRVGARPERDPPQQGDAREPIAAPGLT